MREVRESASVIDILLLADQPSVERVSASH
jgi:hypothetical protein